VEPPRKKYITQKGFERLHAELKQLLYKDRPRVTAEVAVAAAHGDRSENYEYKLGKRKLREIDAKLFRLQKQLEKYEVVEPATRSGARAFFGATVTVEDEDGAEHVYQIVGGDELIEELGPGRISYEAPLGRALLGREAGDSIRVRRPAGEIELTVLRVEWK
jgi:transcription elongation factor GreB